MVDDVVVMEEGLVREQAQVEGQEQEHPLIRQEEAQEHPRIRQEREGLHSMHLD